MKLQSRRSGESWLLSGIFTVPYRHPAEPSDNGSGRHWCIRFVTSERLPQIVNWLQDDTLLQFPAEPSASSCDEPFIIILPNSKFVEIDKVALHGLDEFIVVPRELAHVFRRRFVADQAFVEEVVNDSDVGDVVDSPIIAKLLLQE
jgi:hypothetical protein